MKCDIGNHRWREQRIEKRESEIKALACEVISETAKGSLWTALQNAKELVKKIETQIDDIAG